MTINGDWLNEVYDICAFDDHTDKAIDIMNKEIDILMKDCDVRKLNDLLHLLDINRLNVDLMINFLSATLPFKTKLPARKDFFNKVRTQLELLGRKNVEELLRGLEN